MKVPLIRTSRIVLEEVVRAVAVTMEMVAETAEMETVESLEVGVVQVQDEGWREEKTECSL